MSCQDPTVVLVGIGVVGEAILHAHLDAGVSLVVADIDPSALQQATTKAISGRSDFKASSATWPTDGLNAVALVQRDASIPTIRQADCRLVIESIPERLPIKQAFYAELETWCGPQDVLCSNTSTLRLADIASQMTRAERLAGLHFFMPVAQRSGVEVVRHPRTDPSVISACRDHCRRIGKTAIEVKDSPGFVVNRMLTPYLNEALRLLTAGAKPDQLSAAAMAYGMPLSPLELIDWIGTRTAFDAGRGFWQAFPQRLDPSPLLPALVKAGHLGRTVGLGFYDYSNHERSPQVHPVVKSLVQRYARNPRPWSVDEITDRLATVMRVEADLILQEGVVDTPDMIESAMSGGLGFRPAGNWYRWFNRSTAGQRPG